MNKHNKLVKNGNEITAAPDVHTPEEEVLDDPKFRKNNAPMIKFLNL
jgi:hypothetical protein